MYTYRRPGINKGPGLVLDGASGEGAHEPLNPTFQGYARVCARVFVCVCVCVYIRKYIIHT